MCWLLSSRFKYCLGKHSLDKGQSLVPLPPDNITGKIFRSQSKLSLVSFKFKIISNTLITASYEKNSLDFAEIANYLNKNNIKIEDISTDDGDLEDVFVQLTKH